MNTPPLSLYDQPLNLNEASTPVPIVTFSDQVPPLNKTPSPKKIIRSNSSKRVDHAHLITRINSQKSTNIKRHSKYTMGKRIENIVELRKIDDCLKKSLNTKNKKIILTNDSSVDIITTKDNHLDELMNVKVVEFIYLRILRAMTHQIYYFFDEKGYPVTLRELDKMTRVKYGENHQDFVKEVKKDLGDYYEEKPLFLWGEDIGNEHEYVKHIQTLPFPKTYDIQEIPQKEKSLISILQRLYPKTALNEAEEETVMSPITLLCSYKNFVTTEQLFSQILNVIQLPVNEMPLLQKMRALNLLRVYLHSQLHMDEKMTKKLKVIINKIVLISLDSATAEVVDLGSEINQLMEKNEFYFALDARKDSFEPQYEIGQFLTDHVLKTGNYAQFLNYVTNDLKYLATQSTVNVAPLELFKEKKINETEIFFNQLVNYVVVHFINIFTKELEGAVNAKQVKQKLNRFFEFFIDLAAELANKHDYLSSFAIYTVLNISSISNLLKYQNEPHKKTFSKGRKNSLLKSALTEHKLHELQQLFYMGKNFEVLRNKMKECQGMNLFFVPFLTPIKSMNLHNLELIHNGFKEDNFVINNEELAVISNEVWGLNILLQQVREHFKKDQQFSKHTDIGYDLLANPPYNEDQLDQIYKKIKLILS